jgi:hypothetical protein
MKSLGKTIATVTSYGLITLGICILTRYSSLNKNPFLDSEISRIVMLKEDTETIEKQYFEEYYSRPSCSFVSTFDNQSKELLQKLNEPLDKRRNLINNLLECYESELYKVTANNSHWQDYNRWNNEIREKNKSGFIYGSLSTLAGATLLFLSKKIKLKKQTLKK